MFDGALGPDTVKQLLQDLQHQWSLRGVGIDPGRHGMAFSKSPRDEGVLDRLHPENHRDSRATSGTLPIANLSLVVTPEDIPRGNDQCPNLKPSWI